jgi:hypothetical protein
MTTPYPTEGTSSPVLAELGLFYGQMVEQIRACKNKEKNELQRHQLLMEIARSYSERLQQKMKGYRFRDLPEQVLYYRHIKPLFLSELQYHAYRYEAAVFLRDCTDSELRRRFMHEQHQRFEAFANQQSCFNHFIQSNDKALEKEWFTSPDGKEHSDGTAATKGELLMATWMALQRFHVYIHRQLILEKHAGA